MNHDVMRAHAYSAAQNVVCSIEHLKKMLGKSPLQMLLVRQTHLHEKYNEVKRAYRFRTNE